MIKKVKLLICGCLLFFYRHAIANENLKSSEVTLFVECSDIEIFYSEKGIVKYKLESSLIEKLENDSLRLPKGGTLTGYDNAGDIEFIAHAESAVCSEDNKVWTFEGNVFLEAKGNRLETEKLSWDREEKTLFTKSFVRIATTDSSIIGDGLFAKQDLSHYEIEKPRGNVLVDQ